MKISGDIVLKFINGQQSLINRYLFLLDPYLPFIIKLLLQTIPNLRMIRGIIPFEMNPV